MKKQPSLLKAFIPLLFACAEAFAGGTAGTSSGIFLTLPSDALTAGLGGASSSLRMAPSAVLNNPAGLAGMKTGAAEVSHAVWLGGISYNTLSAAQPLLGGTVALGMRYLRYGGITALDNTGADAGNMAPRDLALSAGWGVELGGGWTAGVAGKYVEARIDSAASAFTLDSGLQFHARGILFGAVAENFGGKLKYKEEAYPLPFRFKLGGAIDAGRGWQVFLDGNMPRGGRGWLNGGLQYPFEISAEMRLSLRGGYNSRYSDTGGMNGCSAGFGLDLKELSFNYAITSMGELGVAHQIGFGLKWGGSRGRREEGGLVSVLF